MKFSVTRNSLPWKWSVPVAAVLLAMPLISYTGSRWIVAKANAAEMPIPSIAPQMLVLSLVIAAGCFLLAAVALRVLTRRGAAEPVRWAVSAAVAPGLVLLAIALCLAAVLFAARPGMTADNMALQFSYLSYQMTIAIPQVLAAAVLLPALRPRRSLRGSALWIGAVLLMPQVAITAVFGIPSVQQGASLLPILWRALAQGLVAVAWAAVAVAALRGMALRMWDALALHCGLWLLAMVLSSLLINISADWLAEAVWPMLSAAVGLAALYCLIQWDHGASPAGPFKALGRRISALAGHFLPR